MSLKEGYAQQNIVQLCFMRALKVDFVILILFDVFDIFILFAYWIMSQGIMPHVFTHFVGTLGNQYRPSVDMWSRIIMNFMTGCFQCP